MAAIDLRMFLKHLRIASWAAIVALRLSAYAQPSEKQVADYAFGAAFIDRNSQLVVFPIKGGRFSVALPVSLSMVEYGPDGKTLYGFSTDHHPSQSGVLKIDLDTMLGSIVPGSAGFRMVDSIAASQHGDELVISGGYPTGGSLTCGIFELTVATTHIRLVAQNATCDYVSSWARLSMSPDGTRAVAYRKQLEIIDLTTGSVRALGGGFIRGAWSPDGKWLAAIGEAPNKGTVIFDARTLEKKRVVGYSDAMWSPDSRYLLGFRQYDLCGPYASTFQLVDAATGDTSTIWSSWCKIGLNTAGWVSEDIRR